MPPKIIEPTTDELKEIKKNAEKFANKQDIKHLVKILRYLSSVYYNTGESIVSDDDYDIMKDVLEERDPENKFLTEIGASVKIDKKKVKLPYPMGSLTKIKPEKKNLENWLQSYNGPFVMSDKVDGISALFEKQSDTVNKLYTRGDGKHGLDISPLIQYLINIDTTKIPIGTCIRGEIIMSKKNFDTISADNKNARNTVSGVVNTKTLDANFKKLIKLCNFVAYAVVFPRDLQQNQFKMLKKYGFETVEYKIEKKINYEMLTTYLKERRKNSIYDIDGIVVYNDEKVYENKTGNPDHAFAFKTILDDQIAIATIIKVIWNISKHGYLKPKIEIEPINLLGTTITYATAFNAKYVYDNKLGPGAKVKLIRSGDVIPDIQEIIEPAKKAQMPSMSYKWTESGVDIIADDPDSDNDNIMVVKQLAFFFKSLNVKFISNGILTKLVNNNYKTVKQIISADKKKLAEIDGIGDKLIDKIYDSIDEAFKNVNLSMLMGASNIFGRNLGEKKIRDIIDTYPNILHETWSKQKLLKNILNIDGFSDITANRFCDNLEQFKKYIHDLNKVVDLSHLLLQVEKKDKTNKLTDKKFVFSGFRDKELENKITDLNGKVSTTVSKNTTAVVKPIGADNTSNKLQNAEKLGIPIITIDELIEQYL